MRRNSHVQFSKQEIDLLNVNTRLTESFLFDSSLELNTNYSVKVVLCKSNCFDFYYYKFP